MARKKPGPRLTKTERAVLRARVVEMSLAHVSGEVIAELVDVTPSYVSHILSAYRKKLQVVSVENLLMERRAQIARFEVVAKEASLAWEKSKAAFESTTTQKSRKTSCSAKGSSRSGKDEQTRAILKRANRDGNPVFLKRWIEAEDKIAQLKNLYPAKRLELTGVDGGPIQLSAEEQRRNAVRTMFEKQLSQGINLIEARSALLTLGVDEEDLDAVYNDLELRERDRHLPAR